MVGLRFREGRRPKVKFSVKRGHGKARDVGEAMGTRSYGADEGNRGGEDGRGNARAKKRKREHGN